ncbi:hypothetical protein [Clostridium niameyense]|nr:hypothetical protein [Clostridium niameyense]
MPAKRAEAFISSVENATLVIKESGIIKIVPVIVTILITLSC